MVNFLEKIFEKLAENKITEWLLSHKWITFGIGVALFGLAIILFQVGDVVVEGRINFFMSGPFVFLIVSGLGLILLSFNAQSMGGFGIKIPKAKGRTRYIGGLKTARKVMYGQGENTINILTKKNHKGEYVPAAIFFSYHKRPFGQLHKLENDGQFYYVHILDVKSRKMVDLVLPDTIYLDPRKYVIPLTMPADEAYWKPTLSTWQKAAPFAIVVTIIIEWIVYITTKGGS